MRHLNFVGLLMLFGASHLLATEPTKLKASLNLVEKTIFVGEGTFVVVKIINTTGRRLYIDLNDLRILTSVEYPDRSGFFGPFSSRGISVASHGGVLPIVHLHEQTSGIEPGESILRFVRLSPSQLVRSAKVTLRAHVTFPGTFDLSIKGEDWSEFEAHGELDFQLIPPEAR